MEIQLKLGIVWHPTLEKVEHDLIMRGSEFWGELPRRPNYFMRWSRRVGCCLILRNSILHCIGHRSFPANYTAEKYPTEVTGFIKKKKRALTT